MKQAAFFLLFFFFFSCSARAASLGIGAEPTVIRLTLSNSRPMQNVSVFVNNPSPTTDDNYTFSISDNLKNYMHWDCSEAGYGGSWCIDKSYFVPANTSRPGYEVVFTFLKRSNAEAVFNGSITARANPIINSSGTVGLNPTLGIRVELAQTNEIATTTTTSVPTTTVATSTATTTAVWQILPASTTFVSTTTEASTTAAEETTTTAGNATMQTTTTMPQKDSMLTYAFIIGGLCGAAVGGYLFLKWYF